MIGKTMSERRASSRWFVAASTCRAACFCRRRRRSPTLRGGRRKRRWGFQTQTERAPTTAPPPLYRLNSQITRPTTAQDRQINNMALRRGAGRLLPSLLRGGACSPSAECAAAAAAASPSYAAFSRSESPAAGRAGLTRARLRSGERKEEEPSPQPPSLTSVFAPAPLSPHPRPHPRQALRAPRWRRPRRPPCRPATGCP
jgi:hypothetical protein